MIDIDDETGEAVGMMSQGYTLLSDMANDWSAVCRGRQERGRGFAETTNLGEVESTMSGSKGIDWYEMSCLLSCSRH